MNFSSRGSECVLLIDDSHILLYLVDGNSSQSDDGHDTDGMDIDRPNKKRKRLQGEDPTVAAENAAIKSLLKREKYVTSEHAARLAVTSGSRSVPNEKPKHKRMMRSTRHSYA